MIPGEYIVEEGEIEINLARETLQLVVENRADRPIQVGSHFHFFEVNRTLGFNREAAYGMRLNIAAGTAVRFEPGERKEVELVALGGSRIVYGMNALVMGELATQREAALEKAKSKGFL